MNGTSVAHDDGAFNQSAASSWCVAVIASSPLWLWYYGSDKSSVKKLKNK